VLDLPNPAVRDAVFRQEPILIHGDYDTDGITASGAAAAVGRTVAMNGVPFGTRLYIEGIGERVVEDRGGMSAQTIDVLCADHPACYAITGWYDVYWIEE